MSRTSSITSECKASLCVYPMQTGRYLYEQEGVCAVTDSRAHPRLAFAADFSKKARPRRPATKDMLVGLSNAAMTRSSCCSFRAVMEGIGTVIEAYQQRHSASCNRCATNLWSQACLASRLSLNHPMC